MLRGTLIWPEPWLKGCLLPTLPPGGSWLDPAAHDANRVERVALWTFKVYTFLTYRLSVQSGGLQRQHHTRTWRIKPLEESGTRRVSRGCVDTKKCTHSIYVFLKKNPHVRGRRKKESFTTECSTVQYTLTLTQLTIWTSGNPRYFVCGQVSHQRNRGTGKSEVSHVLYTLQVTIIDLSKIYQ